MEFHDTREPITEHCLCFNPGSVLTLHIPLTRRPDGLVHPMQLDRALTGTILPDLVEACERLLVLDDHVFFSEVPSMLL